MGPPRSFYKRSLYVKNWNGRLRIGRRSCTRCSFEAGFLYSGRISDCKRPDTNFYCSTNLPLAAEVLMHPSNTRAQHRRPTNNPRLQAGRSEYVDWKSSSISVIPAQAGIQAFFYWDQERTWMPAGV